MDKSHFAWFKNKDNIWKLSNGLFIATFFSVIAFNYKKFSETDTERESVTDTLYVLNFCQISARYRVLEMCDKYGKIIKLNTGDVLAQRGDSVLVKRNIIRGNVKNIKVLRNITTERMATEFAKQK